MSKKMYWRVLVEARIERFSSKDETYVHAEAYAGQGQQVSIYHWNRNTRKWELHKRLRRVKV